MSDARSVTAALGGKWFRGYGLAFCPAHANSHTPALCVADGSDGRLLAHCKAGCSFTDVARALRERGIVEAFRRIGTIPRAPDHFELQREEHRKGQRAQELWRASEPIAGTLAEVYLRSRGIRCDLPATLRFHPSCAHPFGGQYPAMVALVEGGKTPAVHRTYLSADGTSKAAVQPPKAMLGAVGGGGVRLTFEPGPLIVAEGIETTLSLASGILAQPGEIVAALSAPGMKALALPATPRGLVVTLDGDQAGMEAGFALADRAAKLGWKVSILNPPMGVDFNDVLLGRY
ncbi:MAG: toprim domain-containing protein [Bauldia sp.]|nr:toprim domain-containing protein [Bauldia sp.]MCW5716735.1 toprim domain-containing protein [Bauldia sp.]